MMIIFWTTLHCLIILVVNAQLSSDELSDPRCYSGLVTEIQKMVLREIKKTGVMHSYENLFTGLFVFIIFIIVFVILGICTYDKSIRADWNKESDEREMAKQLARIRAVCALHGEPACACMGKYIIATDSSVAVEQDANELWAQQMKPAEAGEEYRDHVE